MPVFGPPDVAKLKAKRNRKGLLKALGYEKDAGIRQTAAQALMDMGISAAREAAQACLAMVDRGDKRALEPAVVLLKDRDRLVRVRAAEVLGKLRDARAIEPLIVALGLFRKSTKRHELPFYAVEALARIGTPEAIVATLETRNSHLTSHAVDTLKKVGSAAVEPLIAALEDKNIFVRQAAVGVLGDLGDARAVDALIAALESRFMRQAAIDALAKIGDARAVEPLVSALEDEDDRVRKVAASALNRLHWKIDQGEAGARYWISIDRHGYLSEVAMEALQKIGNPAVAPLLSALNSEPSEQRRSSFIKVLGEIGEASVVVPLIAALKDAKKGEGKAAAKALAQLGWKPTRSEAGAWYWIYRGDYEKCIAIGESSVSPLIATLDAGANKPARVAMIRALSKSCDARAVKSLITALGDEDVSVRQTAARGLVHQYESGQLKPKDAQLILRQRSKIIEKHTDESGRHTDQGCKSFNCHEDTTPHFDHGVGGDFPL